MFDYCVTYLLDCYPGARCPGDDASVHSSSAEVGGRVEEQTSVQKEDEKEQERLQAIILLFCYFVVN